MGHLQFLRMRIPQYPKIASTGPCIKTKKVHLQFSRKREPGNSFRGPLHITVVKIDDFKDTQLDKLDPVVELELGDELRKTSCIPNAGGTGRYSRANY
jgi:hypothetical protein